MGGDIDFGIALTEARRALDQQAGVLESYRGRASTIVSAATIATAFLGGQAITRHGLGGWASTIAIFTFLACIAAVIVALWPRFGFEFSASPSQLVSDLEGANYYGGLPLSRAVRSLALHMEGAYDRNVPRIDVVRWAVQAACLALAVETVAWILAL